MLYNANYFLALLRTIALFCYYFLFSSSSTQVTMANPIFKSKFSTSLNKFLFLRIAL